jgi:hypothetical protein
VPVWPVGRVVKAVKSAAVTGSIEYSDIVGDNIDQFFLGIYIIDAQFVVELFNLTIDSIIRNPYTAVIICFTI